MHRGERERERERKRERKETYNECVVGLILYDSVTRTSRFAVSS
jgi:hypothetical protein